MMTDYVDIGVTEEERIVRGGDISMMDFMFRVLPICYLSRNINKQVELSRATLEFSHKVFC